VEFYRRPTTIVNRRMGRGDQAWWDRQCRVLHGGTKEREAPDNDDVLRDSARLAGMLQHETLKLQQARRRKEMWVRGLTVGNLAKLPKHQLRCFILFYLEDLKHHEAAVFLDLSDSAVANYLSRARQALSRMAAGVYHPQISSERVTQEPSYYVN